MNVPFCKPNPYRRVIEWGLHAVAWALLTSSQLASAYLLNLAGTCHPGAKWSTTSPVKVKLLTSSFTDYVSQHPNVIHDGLVEAAQMIADVQAVVDEYNAADGSSLRLEYAGSITGDTDLGSYTEDKFDDHTIVVGFTNEPPPSADAPAWTPEYSTTACTYTKRDVRFSKKSIWTFGVPTPSTVDGQRFDGKSFQGGYSFRAVLLHEMGHAVGLMHPKTEYAVMDHGTKAWTRGANEIPTMQLLPDDTTALQILYPVPGGFAVKPDVSLTNTSFLTADQRTQYNKDHDKKHAGCDSQAASVSKIEAQREDQVRVVSELTGHAKQAASGRLSDIEKQLATAQSTLSDCYYKEQEAAQVNNCSVSAKGGAFADPGDGSVNCGVVSTSSSSTNYADTTVCPGDTIQVRYTANNKTPYRVQLQEELWMSADDALDVSAHSKDVRSTETQTSKLDPGASTTLQRYYQVPTGLAPGPNYRVFARVVATDTASSKNLYDQEKDQANNSIRLPGWIKIATTGCRAH